MAPDDASFSQATGESPHRFVVHDHDSIYSEESIARQAMDSPSSNVSACTESRRSL